MTGSSLSGDKFDARPILNDVVVRHPDFEHARSRLTELHASPPGASRFAVLSGQALSGKTLLLQRFREAMAERLRAQAEGAGGAQGVDALPVVIVETPSGASTVALLEATLRSLQVPDPSRGPSHASWTELAPC